MNKIFRIPIMTFCLGLVLNLLGCASFKAENSGANNGLSDILGRIIYKGHESASISNEDSNYNFKFRPFRELVLENGLKIIFVPDDSLPRISLTLLVKAGSMQESKSMAGLNSFMTSLLDEGTIHRSSVKIAEEFGQMGTGVDISPGYDFTTIDSDTLSLYSENLLELFSEIVMHPSFSDLEIKRKKAQVLSMLTKKVDSPSEYATEKMDEFLFGDHPYSRDVNGTLESVKGISKQDLISHYLAYYRPNNSTLAVVGKFDSEYEKLVEKTFSNWDRRTIQSSKAEPASSTEKMQVRLFIKKGLQQSQIRLSQVGISRSDEDFLTLRLGNEILGGGFASRLNQKVRDDLGLTYSISSYFDVRRDKGSFDISTFSKNDSAGRTFDETLKVLNEFVSDGASEYEVNAGKSQLIGQFPRTIETSDRLAFNFLILDFYGIPFDYLTKYNKSVNSLNASKVNAAIKRHLDPTKFKAVIYGNESIIPQFQKYQPEVIMLP